jgi:hypothetical protein
VLSERSSRRFIFTNRHSSGMSPPIAPDPSPCLTTPRLKSQHHPQLHRVSQSESDLIQCPQPTW